MATTRTGKPIVIAGYDPAWPERFRVERELIFTACGRDAFTRIEHVGSTAVPGLGAKPIIDIMPGLRSLDDAPPLIPKLASIGYQYAPETELPEPELNDPGMPFRRYFRKDIAGERAFHMHMVEHGTDFWRDHLLFRNHLRTFATDLRAYEDLKRALAAEFNASPRPDSNINAAYTDYKSDFIEGVLRRARERIAGTPPISVVEYDPTWPRRFDREREAIQRATGEVAIEVQHVGSTSVPGLAAKPYVDIALGVRSLDEGRFVGGPLASLGYHRHRDEDQAPDWRVFHKHGAEIPATPEHAHPPEGEIDVYHLHMVPHDGERWRRYIAFREYMHRDREAAAEYATLKHALAAEFGNDRIGYTEAKSDFVLEIYRRAGVG